MTEQTIFLEALDLPPDRRSTYLDTACADNPALRREVEALLAAHAKSGLFLDEPAVEQLAAGRHTVTADAPVGPDTPTLTGPGSAPGGATDLAFLEPPTRPGSIGRLAHYEVLEVLGRGGFGTVLRAFDDRLHRVVAIKVLAPQLATRGPARARFYREAKATAAVRDEHVVGIHAVSEDAEPVPYLVMEYIAGQTLQQKIDRTGPLSVPEILRIGTQIAKGLAAAHATGHIHRDVKPANILLENGVERVKITDFGLARTADDASISHSGLVAGTPHYMAPEQAHGGKIDQRADLFGLGSVLYAMCTGHPPFRASTTMAVLKRVCEADPRPIREVNPEVPDWLAAVIARLHAKKPEDRFPSAREVAELLEQHLAHLHEPDRLPRPAPVARPVPPAADRPSVIWSPDLVLGVAGMAAAVAAFIVYVQWQDGTLRERWPVDLGAAAVVAALLVRYSRQAGRARPAGAPARWGWWLAGAAANVLLFLAAAYYLDGPIRLILRNEAKVTLADAAHAGVVVTVRQNGAVVHDRSPDTAFVLDAGAPAEVRVFRAATGVELLRKEVPLRAGMTTVVSLARELVVAEDRNRVGPEAPGASAEGFVSLFNGTDLSGWTAAPKDPSPWSVKDGVLRGAGLGVLYAHRREYADFHLRAVARVNDGGSGGILFRGDKAKLEAGQADGYQALLNATVQNRLRTGSLEDTFTHYHTGKDPLVKPGEWFTYEVIAQGYRLELKVNGQTTLEWTDGNRQRSIGHLGLQVDGDRPVVEFKSIEVKELPKTAARPTAGQPVKLRAFTPGKDPLPLPHRGPAGAVTVVGDAWRIENANLGGNFNVMVAQDLSGLPKDGVLVLRAKVKVEGKVKEKTYSWGDLGFGGANQVYASWDQWPAARARYDGHDTEWTEKEARYPAAEAHEKAPSVYLCAGLHDTGVMWLKDVELLHLPAATDKPAAPPVVPAARQPVRVRAFAPGKDPLPLPHRGPAKAVTVDGDAWRIENANQGGNFNVMVAQGIDGLPMDGVLVFRAKVKVEARHKMTWGDLGFGAANHLFVSWDGWPAARARYDGLDTEWTEKEVRYPAAEVHKNDPPTVYLYAGLHADGVLWLKDVELLHIPAVKKP